MPWSSLTGRGTPRFRPGGANALRPVALLAAVSAILPFFPAFARAQAAPPAPTARFVVVLDAAHGGDDPGASLDGQPEKNFTLALSVRLRSLLAARGISVVTTREADITLDSLHRAEIANRANAQACLILHATESGFGVHLFTSSLTAAQPAVFEPWKTAQAAWVTRSLALEGVLNSALQHAGIDVTMDRTQLPTLDSLNCPAAAVEVAPRRGLPSSLSDDSYQSQVADALAGALLEWRSEGPQL